MPAAFHAKTIVSVWGVVGGLIDVVDVFSRYLAAPATAAALSAHRESSRWSRHARDHQMFRDSRYTYLHNVQLWN